MWQVSVHYACVAGRFPSTLFLMQTKEGRIEFRIERGLKRSFESAARFQHQSLTQFLLQSGIAAVESARARGLGIKPPPAPRDGRRTREAT